jgi:uncharacterized membrane-anchored protein YjiN (DUF445 family)
MEQLKNQVEGSVEKTTQKTFTQDEVNGLIAKEVSKALKDKTDASALEQLKAEAENYKKQYNDLITSQKQQTLKQTFVKNGGIEDRFNDFAKLNDEIINKDMKDYDNEVRKVIEKQPYLFNKELVKDIKVNDEKDKPIPSHFPF